MKGKKILALLMAMLLVVTAVVTLVACTDGNVNGTYYLFKNEKIQKDSFITLDGSTWKDENGDSGSYTVSGKAITLYVELLGEKVEYATGSIDNGVLTITIMGEEIVYCKEGKEPSGGNDKPPVTIKYSVTYDANKGIFKNNVSTMVTSDLASQSLLTAPESPTRDGYNFSGWSKSKNKSDMWNFATDKITSNITLYAVWQQESATIFSMEGASINGKKIFMLVDSATDSVSLSNKIVCSEDSTWRLYYDKLGQMEIPTKIAASRNGELVDGNNVFYIVVTSSNGTQVNVYELTVYRSFKISINFYDGDILLHSTPLYSGDKITSDDVYSYVKEGYTFNAWRTSDGQEFKPGEIWGSVTLFADTTANEYTVTLNTNGADELKNNTKTVTYDSKFILPMLSRDGYTFAGWYLDNTMLTDKYGESLTAWNYTSDKELTAKWIINEHTVTIESNYPTAGVIKGAGKYDFGSTINITIVENMGYKYLGLYNGNTLITDETEYTFTLADEEVSLTAKFELFSEMADFNFTSTPTTCKINSLKNTSIKDIIIPSYVTEIGEGAFYGYYSIESLTLPSLTDNLLGNMFKDSRGNISLPQSFKSVIIIGGETIGENAFLNCNTITNITIPQSVTSISKGAFSGCSGLVSITIPETVTSIGESAFSGCSSIVNFTIPNSVTSIGVSAFSGCSGLVSITIPETVTSIGESAFSGCRALVEAYYSGTIAQWCAISGLENLKPYVAGYNKKLFIDGNEVTGDLVIPDSVTSISDYAFYGYTEITSITIGNSVTSIGECAFSNSAGVGSLKSVTIPKSVTTIGLGAFYSCHALNEVRYDGTIAQWCAISGLSNLMGYGSNKKLYIGGNEVAGDIVIPDGAKFIGSSAFYGCSGLTSVTLPDSVTSIGDYAFYNCSSLTSVTIPNSVTSIGDYAFRYCSGLTNVTIGSAVTSIGAGAFSGCSNISEVRFNGIIAQWCSIIGIGNLMQYALNKKLYICGDEVTGDLVIPDGVTSIGDYAFYNCSSLTSVTIPNSVTSIGSSAFSGCSSLTSVTIGNSVTSIGDYAFRYCSGLTNVTIGSAVTSIGAGAFRDCSSLTSVTIPDSVTSIGAGAFRDCSSLTSVTIPDSVTSIGYGAFEGCSNLTSVTIGSGVTSIDQNAFYDCYALAEVYNLSSLNITRGSTYYGHVAYYALSVYTSLSVPSKLSEKDGMILHTNGENLTLVKYIGDATSVIIPNSVTSIGNSAFSGCSSLTSISIPNSVTSIGNSAFSGCSSLTSVTIPDSVTIIGSYAFYYCSGITSVTIPDSVTSIGSYAFYDCSNLTSVTIGSGVTSIGDRAFGDCYILAEVYNLSSLKITKGSSGYGYVAYYALSVYTSLSVPSKLSEKDGMMLHTDGDNITLVRYIGNETNFVIPNYIISIGSGAFYNCSNLTCVIIPDSVKSIGSYAFYNCSGLTSVTIPNSVTSIGNWAFYGCSSLTSVTIPNSVTSIGNWAFYGCSSLTSVTIPDSVTSIGSWAFCGCSGLASITIPNSITIIGHKAFSGCSALTSISIPNSVTSIGSYAFYDCSSLTSVIFENTTGWFVLERSDAINGTAVTVTDPSQNAKYLTSTYCDYYWKRK